MAGGEAGNLEEQTMTRPLNKTSTLSIAALLSALCISTNYLMLPLFNIKIMDTIVFVAGFYLGIVPGTIVASTAWLVYGTLNPLGFSLPTLISVMSTEPVYALAGSIIRRRRDESSASLSTSHIIVFGAAGLFATFTYDLITNALTGLLFYDSIWIGLLTMNFPLPLGLIHEVSNFTLFALVAPLLIHALKKFLGR